MACTLPQVLLEVVTMDKDFLASQAQLLRDQKTHFLHTFSRAEEGLAAIAEDRESELEEQAQEEQSARFLTWTTGLYKPLRKSMRRSNASRSEPMAFARTAVSASLLPDCVLCRRPAPAGGARVKVKTFIHCAKRPNQRAMRPFPAT